MMTSDEFIEAMIAALPPETTEGDKNSFRATLYALINLAYLEKMVALIDDLQRVNQITRG